MSLNRSIQKFNKKVTDPLGGINKLGDKWGMQDVTDLYREGPFGNASGWKQAAGSEGGSYLSGRAILQGGAKEQDMEKARTVDVFGAPAHAGGNQQTSARTAAAIYGLAMGGVALGGMYGAGAAGGSGVGWGGTTSASSAPTSYAGSANPFVTNMGYGGGTVGSAAPSAGSSWQDYARQGSQMNPGGGGGGGEYEQEDYSAEDEQRRYWAGRGMELRAMADQAVRRYLS